MGSVREPTQKRKHRTEVTEATEGIGREFFGKIVTPVRELRGGESPQRAHQEELSWEPANILQLLNS